MPPRILLIADFAEPLGPEACSAAAAFGFEVAMALAACVEETDEIGVDLIARRGSETPLPLIGVDPSELLPDGHTLSRVRAGADEALLCQVALSGLMSGYDIVHSLIPVVAPLQIAAAGGASIVTTVASRRGAEAASILSRIVHPKRLVTTIMGRGIDTGQRHIPIGVDLARFRPADRPSRHSLVWLGSGGRAGRRTAEAIARGAALPLRTFGDDDVVPLLQHARALLHFGNLESVWPLRALACGTAVADSAQRIDDDGDARRRTALALHGSRAMIGHVREVYRELTDAG